MLVSVAPMASSVWLSSHPIRPTSSRVGWAIRGVRSPLPTLRTIATTSFSGAVIDREIRIHNATAATTATIPSSVTQRKLLLASASACATASWA